MERIFLVDDEPCYANELKQQLKGDFEVSFYDDPLAILNSEGQHNFTEYDLILVDLRMPSMDGISFLIRLKEKHPNLPAQVVITQAGTDSSRILAFENYLYDFIDKGITTRELKARLKNSIAKAKPKADTNFLSFETLKYSPDSLSFTIKGSPLDLTKKETLILFTLAQSNTRSIKKNDLISQIWKKKLIVPQTLNTHIFNLNMKLSPYGYQITTLPSGLVRLKYNPS